MIPQMNSSKQKRLLQVIETVTCVGLFTTKVGAFIPSTEAMAIPAVSKGGVEGPAGTAVAVPLLISLRLRRSRFTTLWTRPQTHSDWGRDQAHG